MKTRLSSLMIMVAMLCSAHRGTGQDFDAPSPYGWSFRLGGVARFNLKEAGIERIPPVPLASRVYDDGFVRPDIGGTASGKTWNWGYTAPGQIQGDQLVLTRLDNLPYSGRSSKDFGAMFGGEIIAGYQLVHFEIGARQAHVGVEVGYGYAGGSRNLRSTFSSRTRRTMDRFDLDGVIPPAPPYTGTAQGPGPLIDLGFDRTVSFAQARNDMRGTFDLALHTFRLGPVLELELTPRFGVAMGIGYSSMYADVDWDATEAVSFADPAFPAFQQMRHHEHYADWRPGAYAELRLQYFFNKWAGVYIGGDIHYNDNLRYRGDIYRLELELGMTYAAKGGVIVRF